MLRLLFPCADMRGLSMSMFTGAVMDIFSKVAEIDKNHYPETLHQVRQGCSRVVCLAALATRGARPSMQACLSRSVCLPLPGGAPPPRPARLRPSASPLTALAPSCAASAVLHYQPAARFPRGLGPRPPHARRKDEKQNQGAPLLHAPPPRPPPPRRAPAALSPRARAAQRTRFLTRAARGLRCSALGWAW